MSSQYPFQTIGKLLRYWLCMWDLGFHQRKARKWVLLAVVPHLPQNRGGNMTMRNSTPTLAVASEVSFTEEQAYAPKQCKALQGYADANTHLLGFCRTANNVLRSGGFGGGFSWRQNQSQIASISGIPQLFRPTHVCHDQHLQIHKHGDHSRTRNPYKGCLKTPVE